MQRLNAAVARDSRAAGLHLLSLLVTHVPCISVCARVPGVVDILVNELAQARAELDAAPARVCGGPLSEWCVGAAPRA